MHNSETKPATKQTIKHKPTCSNKKTFSSTQKKAVLFCIKTPLFTLKQHQNTPKHHQNTAKLSNQKPQKHKPFNINPHPLKLLFPWKFIKNAKFHQTKHKPKHVELRITNNFLPRTCYSKLYIVVSSYS
jgi:hypothetical protein